MRISLEPSYKKDYFDIYVEGELFIQSPGSLITLFSIRENFDFDMSDLSCFAVAVNLYLCKTEAYRLLARKALSEAELSQKLQDAGFIHETILTIISIFSLTGQINDEALALEFACYRSSRALNGPRRVRQELRLRSLPREQIDAALEVCFAGDREEELAEEAIEHKYLRLNKPRKRDKIYLFLVRRGFSSAVAAKLAARYSQEEGRTHNDEEQPEEQCGYSEGFF